MSCGVGYRRGSDSTFLWLWHRLAATAPIGPLPWEIPSSIYRWCGPKKTKKKKKKKRGVGGGLVAAIWGLKLKRSVID